MKLVSPDLFTRYPELPFDPLWFSVRTLPTENDLQTVDYRAQNQKFKPIPDERESSAMNTC